jgi:hypothetical protein
MKKERSSRQTFLGDGAQALIEGAVVGVVGLGGGGSHIVQQLAHIGFLRYVIYDPDVVEESNLNRLVGATESDVPERRLKIDIAKRVIGGLQSKAVVEAYAQRWQEKSESLRACDLIFGCLDGFSERRELEAMARRFLTPLIDVGMDVHSVGDEPPRMGGQIILSIPGGPCMFCLGFLNERTIAREGERYGDAGSRPQVVWPNGVLASTAVGIALDLLTNWARAQLEVVYLEYDGNSGTLQPSSRIQYRPEGACPHYPKDGVGDIIL